MTLGRLPVDEALAASCARVAVGVVVRARCARCAGGAGRTGVFARFDGTRGTGRGQSCDPAVELEPDVPRLCRFARAAANPAPARSYLRIATSAPAMARCRARSSRSGAPDRPGRSRAPAATPGSTRRRRSPPYGAEAAELPARAVEHAVVIAERTRGVAAGDRSRCSAIPATTGRRKAADPARHAVGAIGQPHRGGVRVLDRRRPPMPLSIEVSRYGARPASKRSKR